MSEVSQGVNAAQAQRWNGAGGWYWIEHRERHLAEQQYLTPHMFDRAAIAPGEHVLDVGCGCGDTTIRAARAAAGLLRERPGGAGSALGLDLSAPMLKVARQLVTRAGVTNAWFVQGDAQACPLRPAAFDVVISNFGVMFFADPGAAFAGLAAVVRPRGRLSFLCWQDDTKNEVFGIPLKAIGAYLELPGPSAGALFGDPRQITGLLSATGWRDVKVTAVDEMAKIGSDLDDVMGYIRGMPMIRTLMAGLDPALRERVLADVAGQYSTRRDDDGIWVQAAAWLVTARRALSPDPHPQIRHPVASPASHM